MENLQRWVGLAAGSILFALAMAGLLAAPGLLEDQSNTVSGPHGGPPQKQ